MRYLTTLSYFWLTLVYGAFDKKIRLIKYGDGDSFKCQPKEQFSSFENNPKKYTTFKHKITNCGSWFFLYVLSKIRGYEPI